VRRFDEAVTSQMAVNGMHPKVAEKAQDKLRKAGRKFAEGDERAGVREVSHVIRDLRKARDKGEIAPAGPLSDWLNDWQI
jgi:serine/threonine-protein kinase